MINFRSPKYLSLYLNTRKLVRFYVCFALIDASWILVDDFALGAYLVFCFFELSSEFESAALGLVCASSCQTSIFKNGIVN